MELVVFLLACLVNCDVTEVTGIRRTNKPVRKKKPEI
jgi:hypothetical protein